MSGLRPPPDQDIVVVGATGDLAARKLLPALYNLNVDGLLPKGCDIVGVAPMDWSTERFVEHAEDSIRQFSRTGIRAVKFKDFAKRLRFINAGDQGDLSPLRGQLRRKRRLVYLAVPPSAFTELIGGIKAAGLREGTSLVIEKPFGDDLKSARVLNVALHQVLAEAQIFRIDHYLGKETVQNLMVFRFGNSLFERVWNRDAIAHVEITVAESLGVEQRGAFYEATGAVRDIVQNHLFQVLAVVAMEAPNSFDAEAIRNEKVKVLDALHRADVRDVVRGQYTAGTVEGKRVVGYRQEHGVSRTSQTETYAALRLHIDSWRWSGVPFVLRTGKRLKTRDTRIVVVFRDPPLRIFRGQGIHHVDSNRLVVRIQPNEGIAFDFVAKQPGPQVLTQAVGMDFSYGTSFKTSPPEAYERLLHDALNQDHTLFIRQDEVERGWEVVQPILDNPPTVVEYRAGSWGPAEAERIAKPGHWHIPDA